MRVFQAVVRAASVSRVCGGRRGCTAALTRRWPLIRLQAFLPWAPVNINVWLRPQGPFRAAGPTKLAPYMEKERHKRDRKWIWSSGLHRKMMRAVCLACSCVGPNNEPNDSGGGKQCQSLARACVLLLCTNIVSPQTDTRDLKDASGSIG